MMAQKIGDALLLSVMLVSTCFGSVQPASRIANRQPNLSNHDRQFGIIAVSYANFSTMSRITTRISCEATQPPEALATPDPLVESPSQPTKITVSFIIGTDGRVHSPLILEGLGAYGDRIVLDAVRTWRYRPATCNGVPTEVEGKIAFSSREGLLIY